MLALEVAFHAVTAAALTVVVAAWFVSGVPSWVVLVVAVTAAGLAHARVEGLRRQLAQQERE